MKSPISLHPKIPHPWANDPRIISFQSLPSLFKQGNWDPERWLTNLKSQLLSGRTGMQAFQRPPLTSESHSNCHITSPLGKANPPTVGTLDIAWEKQQSPLVAPMTPTCWGQKRLWALKARFVHVCGGQKSLCPEEKYGNDFVPRVAVHQSHMLGEAQGL